jgi:hypothetical protein
MSSHVSRRDAGKGVHTIKGKMMNLGILLLVSALVIGGCTPAGQSSRPSDPVGARDAVLAYLAENYGAEAPAAGLAWTEKHTKPEGLVGGESYEYTAGDWVIAVSYPVVAPENVVYTIQVSNQATGFRWEGQVDAQGQVTETSFGGQSSRSSSPESKTPEPVIPPSSVSGTAVLRVAYFGGGRIKLWDEGKGSRGLAEANNVEQIRISDDGQVIAYLGLNALGGYGIYAINADGTNQHALVGPGYLNTQVAERAVQIDFAPSSHTLYFVTEQYDLHRVNADSGSPTLIFGAGEGGFFSFSPDGQWVTLYHPNELVLARLDGSEAHSVFQYPEDFRYTMMGPEVVWASDSHGFSIVSASAPQNSPNNMAVWFVPLAGAPVKEMSYTGPYGAYLSPDGRTVVYLYYQHTPVDVHVVAADGRDTTLGSYTNVDFLGWAPDSEHFLLNLSQDLRLVVPYICALGEEPVEFTDTDDALPVVWIDAQRALFASHGRALYLEHTGAPSILLDTDASSWFDYAYVSP